MQRPGMRTFHQIQAMKDGAPFISLGIFKPSVKLYPASFWKAKIIGREMMEFLRPWKLTPHRDPKHGPEECASWLDDAAHAQVRRHNWEGPGGSFHQDGDTTAGASMNCAMVLWTDNHPTEFQNGGEIYAPSAFEVVLFRNLGCYHRRPINCPFDRWTFRQRVVIPAHIKLP